MKLYSKILLTLLFISSNVYSFEFLRHLDTTRNKAILIAGALLLGAIKIKNIVDEEMALPSEKTSDELGFELLSASEKGRVSEVNKLVANSDTDIDFQDNGGNTPLMLATQQVASRLDELTAIDLGLIELFVKIDDKEKTKLDNKKVAIKKEIINYLDIVDILLDSGASLQSIRNNNKDTAYTLLFPIIAQLHDYIFIRDQEETSQEPKSIQTVDDIAKMFVKTEKPYTNEDLLILEKLQNINSNYLSSTKVLIGSVFKYLWR